MGFHQRVEDLHTGSVGNVVSRASKKFRCKYLYDFRMIDCERIYQPSVGGIRAQLSTNACASSIIDLMR